MSKFYVFLLLLPVHIYGQFNDISLPSKTMLTIEANPGFYESGTSIKFPVNANNSLTYSHIWNLNQLDSGSFQFLGIGNSIDIDRSNKLIFDAGYLFQLRTGINFDPTARITYAHTLKNGSYFGSSLFASLSNEVSKSNIPSFQITVGHEFKKPRSRHGIIRYHPIEWDKEVAMLYGLDFSVLNISLNSSQFKTIWMQFQAATNVGYFFAPSRDYLDWQSISIAKRHILNDFIYFQYALGPIFSIHHLDLEKGLVANTSVDIVLSDDIAIRLQLTQSTRFNELDRARPWILLGLNFHI